MRNLLSEENMNSLKTFMLVLLIASFTVSAAWSNTVADELVSINNQLENLVNSEKPADLDLENTLRARETELFTELLKSEKTASEFLQVAFEKARGQAERFLARVRFEVVHEGREDLRTVLEKWSSNLDGSSASRSKKKVAFIYGCEVNLYDGEWRTAPDGRRFWVSNEYPDIILSPAEYQKYLKTAATVED